MGPFAVDSSDQSSLFVGPFAVVVRSKCCRIRIIINVTIVWNMCRPASLTFVFRTSIEWGKRSMTECHFQ